MANKVLVTHYFQDTPEKRKGALTYTTDGKIYRGDGTETPIEYGGRVKGVKQNNNDTAAEPDENGIVNIGNVIKSLTINNGAVYTPDSNGRVDAWTDAHQKVTAKTKVCQNTYEHTLVEDTSLFRYTIECELAGTDVYMGNIDDIPSANAMESSYIGHFKAEQTAEPTEKMYIPIFSACSQQGKMLVKFKINDYKLGRYETHWAQIAYGTANWTGGQIDNSGCFGIQSSLSWKWRTFFGHDANSSTYTSSATNINAEYGTITTTQKQYMMALYLEIPTDFRGSVEWNIERKMTNMKSSATFPTYTWVTTSISSDGTTMNAVPFCQSGMAARGTVNVATMTNAQVENFNHWEYTDQYNEGGTRFGYYEVDSLASLGENFGDKNFDDPDNPVYIADTIVNDYLLHWVIKKVSQLSTDFYWSNT